MAAVTRLGLGGYPVAVLFRATVVPPPVEETTRRSGAPGKRRVKYQDRYYDPERDRRRLAEDWLANHRVEPQRAKRRRPKPPIIRPAEPEVPVVPWVAPDHGFHQIQEYVTAQQMLAQRIEMEDEEEAIALLLAV